MTVTRRFFAFTACFSNNPRISWIASGWFKAKSVGAGVVQNSGGTYLYLIIIITISVTMKLSENSFEERKRRQWYIQSEDMEISNVIEFSTAKFKEMCALSKMKYETLENQWEERTTVFLLYTGGPKFWHLQEKHLPQLKMGEDIRVYEDISATGLSCECCLRYLPSIWWVHYPWPCRYNV